MAPLPRRFYLRPADVVAPELLGRVLVHQTPAGLRAGWIVEVEAYLGEQDPAAHAASGRTRRTEVLYGPGGFAYVYLVYGVHYCLNVATGGSGEPGCVLIRALDPIPGVVGGASGPGRLTRALGISLEQYGADFTNGTLTIRGKRFRRLDYTTSDRIGIKKAMDWPLRYYLPPGSLTA
jgi:DNA-3-methyladenine glycosylase